MAVAPALGRSLIPPTWKPTTPWWTPAWIHFQAERLQILMGFGATDWRPRPYISRLQDLGQTPQQNIGNYWVLYVMKQQKWYIYIYKHAKHIYLHMYTYKHSTIHWVSLSLSFYNIGCTPFPCAVHVHGRCGVQESSADRVRWCQLAQLHGLRLSHGDGCSTTTNGGDV
jgi:hypothetical protein